MSTHATAVAPRTELRSLEQLPVAWRAHAAHLHRYGADQQARVLEAVADELEAALRTEADTLIPLERAAVMSGYNADSLRRMVRERKLHAERRGRRLFFRACELPRKLAEAPAVDGPHLVRYDPVADARLVAGQRQRGA